MAHSVDFAYMEQIIRHIVEQAEIFEETFDLQLSFHFANRQLEVMKPQLGRFWGHRNCFCIRIKSERRLHKCCYALQRMVIASLNRDPTPRFAVCCFGVEEYVLPVMVDQTVVGFISVSGYTADPEKTWRKAAARLEKIGITIPELEEDAKQLSQIFPDPELLRRLLTPIADLLASIYIRPQPRRDLSSYTYNSVLAYVEANYDRPITVPLLAERLRCSESYINHIFKKHHGIGISRYVNEVRINRAKELLRSTDLSIAEISASVGFNDTNYFTYVFRTIVGCVPTRYRGK